jgi:hypothetical protein
MKRIYVVSIIALLALVAALYYMLILKPEQTFDAQNAAITIERPEAGLEFSYVAGPDALSLFEPETVQEPLSNVFIFVPSTQYVALRNQEEIDTPPSISLFVYNQLNAFERPDENGEDLPRIDRIKRWANENDGVTGISRAIAEPVPAEIDGLRGLYYQTEGTFLQDVYIFSYQDRIHFFVGQYEEEGDQMQQRFEELLENIYFI